VRSGPNRLDCREKAVGVPFVEHGIRRRSRGLVRVPDGVRVAGDLEHGRVVLGVPDGRERGGVDAERLGDDDQPTTLVHVRRLDVVGEAGVDDREAPFRGEALQYVEGLVAADREFGLAPAVHEVRFPPAETVARRFVGLRDRPCPVRVAGEHHLVALYRDHAAVLRDDGDWNPEELTECNGVGKGLPGRDDDRSVPLAQDRDHPRVDPAPVVRQGPVDVDGKRRRHRSPSRFVAARVLASSSLTVAVAARVA